MENTVEFECITNGTIDFSVHPIKPWIAILDSQNNFSIWDYDVKEKIATVSLSSFEAEKREFANSQRTVERSEGYMGPKLAEKMEINQKSFKVGSGKFIQFFDPETRSCKAMMESTSSKMVENSEYEVQCVAADLTRDYSHYVIVMTEHHIFCWDYVLSSWRIIDMQYHLGKQALCMEFFSHGTDIAFGCIDGVIRLWDTQNWKLERKISSSNNKSILQMISFFHKGASYLVSMSSDLTLQIWCIDEEEGKQNDFTYPIKISKDGRDIFDMCMNYVSGEILVLVNNQIVVVDCIGKKTRKIDLEKEYIRMETFYHPAFPQNSVALLSSQKTTICCLDTSVKSQDKKYINVISFESKEKHILDFYTHPIVQHRYFVQTHGGIHLVNVEMKHSKPNFVLLPGKLNYDQVCFQYEASIVSFPFKDLDNTMGLAANQRNVSKLQHSDHALLLASHSKKYVIIFWKRLSTYQLARVEDWSIISEGDARSIAWCDYKDIFVVVHSYAGSEEDANVKVHDHDPSNVSTEKRSKFTRKIPTTITNLYVIGLPLGALFAFYLNLGVMGLWYGMGIGMVFQLVSLLFLIFFQDWDKLAEEVRTREIGADGSTDAVQLLSQVRNDDDDEDSDEAHFALGLPSSKNFVDDNDLFN